MKKHKILALLLTISLLAAPNTVLSAESKKNNSIKPVSKKLKGGVSDYRIEYINADWWDKFNDPILKEYVLKATNSNHDLKIATLKVSEMHSLVRESLGKEFPVLGIGTNFSRQKTSENMSMGSFRLPSYTQNSYLLPLSVNYELDLWRKNRDKTIREAKELEAVRFEEKSAYISLTSAVAAAYFNTVKTDKLLDLQKKIVDVRQNILELTKESNKYGLCAITDVIMANKALTEANIGLRDLEKQQSLFLNQLAVLTGQSIDNSSGLKRAAIEEIELIGDLPSAVQSDVVLKRPDILAAEADLQKSRIDVSLARKDFLPDISLAGQFGFNAISLSKVFQWESYVTSLGASIAQDIFSGGQRRARLKAKKIRYEQVLEGYQKTILTSFQEVNDSLVALKSDIQKNKDNLSRISLEKENLDLIEVKYDYGAISFLDTLSYKERYLVLEKDLTQSKTDCLIDSLSLYKAVGGKL